MRDDGVSERGWGPAEGISAFGRHADDQRDRASLLRRLGVAGSKQHELLLPLNASTHLELSSFEGEIDNGFTQLRPAASSARNLELTIGSGASEITVRTFRGTVRLRAREP